MPRTGHDPFMVSVSTRLLIFQSTCPVRGTTLLAPFTQFWLLFQSTCPVRGTTSFTRIFVTVSRNFNPRAPYGARLNVYNYVYIPSVFQSTCPVRGTTHTSAVPPPSSCISIHVPCTGHDSAGRLKARTQIISIHVPCTGHDTATSYQELLPAVFQSTCPVRGTTRRAAQSLHNGMEFQSTCPVRGTTRSTAKPLALDNISIHVPCTGHDAAVVLLLIHGITFQSTCPVRGTTTRKGGPRARSIFQSTCPVRGTTRDKERNVLRDDISIHVPCTGHDAPYNRRLFRRRRFQSTCPVRGTTNAIFPGSHQRSISIHVPCTGHDRERVHYRRRSFISIHVPCTGHDTQAAHFATLI